MKRVFLACSSDNFLKMEDVLEKIELKIAFLNFLCSYNCKSEADKKIV